MIAWLLGRASADAVDTAFREIKQQLRNAAPPGAASVSNPETFWPVLPTRRPARSLPPFTAHRDHTMLFGGPLESRPRWPVSRLTRRRECNRQSSTITRFWRRSHGPAPGTASRRGSHGPAPGTAPCAGLMTPHPNQPTSLLLFHRSIKDRRPTGPGDDAHGPTNCNLGLRALGTGAAAREGETEANRLGLHLSPDHWPLPTVIQALGAGDKARE